MKNSYQVIAGMHIATDKTYKKGQSVVSDQDLVKMYPGKFRLEGPVKSKKAKPEPSPAEDDDETVTETETETLPPTKAKKKKAKVEKADDWDD